MPVGEIRCMRCGDVFVAQRASRMTCSDRCRQAMRRARISADAEREYLKQEESVDAIETVARHGWEWTGRGWVKAKT